MDSVAPSGAKAFGDTTESLRSGVYILAAKAAVSQSDVSNRQNIHVRLCFSVVSTWVDPGRLR